MAERASNNSEDAALADLKAQSPEPDWLTQATDQELFDQLYDAFELESLSKVGQIPSDDEETISVAKASLPAEPTPIAAIEDPVLAPAKSLPSRRELRMQEQRRKKYRGSRTTNIILAVVGLVGLVLLAIWGANTFFTQQNENANDSDVIERNTEPGDDGIIASNVPADQLQVGDCLTDYSDPTASSTVIDCTMPHEAQLVGRKEFPAEDQFPGDDELAVMSQDFCNSVGVVVPAGFEHEMTLTRPIAETWSQGDRVVDCIMSVTSGSVEESFLPEE